MKPFKTFKIQALLAITLATASPAALAYLDPGTGSILFQAAIAGLLAALFYFRTIWYRIKSFFTGKPYSPEKIELPPAEEASENMAKPKG